MKDEQGNPSAGSAGMPISGPGLNHQALEELRDQLGDPRPEVRRDAVRQIEAGVRPAQQKLLESWLHHRDPLVRNTARRGLDRLQKLQEVRSEQKQQEERRLWIADLRSGWIRHRRAVILGIVAGILVMLAGLMIDQWRTLRDELDLRSGETLFFAGRVTEALEKIDRFLQTHPGHPAALARKIDVLTQLGRLAEADGLLMRLEAASDGDERFQRFALKRMLREGRFAEGVVIYESLPEAIRRDPQVRLEGLLARWKDQPDDPGHIRAVADSVAEFSLEMPGFRGIQLLRARLDEAMGQTEIALARVNDLLTLLPRDNQALALRGTLQLAAGRMKEAEADLEAALAAGNSDAETRFNLALVLEKLRKPGAAMVEYSQLLSAVPADRQALLNRAVLHAESGDPDREMQDYQQLSRLRGTPEPGMFFNAGLNRMEAGDTRGAYRFMNRVSGDSPLREQARQILDTIPPPPAGNGSRP